MTSAPPAQADAELTEEQQDFVRAVRDFCRRECGPERLGELTHGFDDLHNEDIARRMAELGWYCVAIDEEYGGLGGGLVEVCHFLEETYYGDVQYCSLLYTMDIASML